jgi:hypothetical protein
LEYLDGASYPSTFSTATASNVRRGKSLLNTIPLEYLSDA